MTKVRRFSGESDDLEDWITDTERTVGQLGLKDKEAANHVLLHLEGAARRELRGQTMNSMEDIFAALRKAFGESLEVSELEGRFYRRNRKDGETLIDYSHVLSGLVQRIDKLDPGRLGNKDKVLRDRFKDGVQNEQLVAWLKQRVRDYPGKSFRELRDEAIKYSADMGKTKKVKSNQVATTCAIAPTSDDTVKLKQQIADLQQGQRTLLEILEEQQKMLQKATCPDHAAPPREVLILDEASGIGRKLAPAIDVTSMVTFSETALSRNQVRVGRPMQLILFHHLLQGIPWFRVQHHRYHILQEAVTVTCIRLIITRMPRPFILPVTMVRVPVLQFRRVTRGASQYCWSIF